MSRALVKKLAANRTTVKGNKMSMNRCHHFGKNTAKESFEVENVYTNRGATGYGIINIPMGTPITNWNSVPLEDSTCSPSYPPTFGSRSTDMQ